ncbi:MAG: UbiA family prenyltransferase [Planctomyces sp.]|nr:UbiA family prenyltransferase [Planctomyces sp.]
MSTIRTYAQLCRLPAVFTALADIVLGFLLTRLTLAPVREFTSLLAASAGLYLAGMVLNDLFDRREDAIERPNRPIPAGRVSSRTATAVAGALIVFGLSGAALAGRNSLLIALLLLGNIFLYDGWLKRTPLGPLAMGGCRFLNIILGASSASTRLVEAFLLPQLLVALGMGVYVVGVTWFARRDSGRSPRGHLVAALAVVNLGLLILAAWIAPEADRFLGAIGWQVYRGDAEPWRALALLGVIAFVLNRRAIGAILDPSPAVVQNAVRIMLLSIITLDAMLIYNKLGEAGTPYAVGTVALLVPALLLGRWMTMT